MVPGKPVACVGAAEPVAAPGQWNGVALLKILIPLQWVTTTRLTDPHSPIPLRRRFTPWRLRPNPGFTSLSVLAMA
jgi:hypothetical protein